MSTKVGELIIATRALIPDMPETLSTPALPNFTVADSGIDPGWGAGDYYFKVAWLTPYGETLPSPSSAKVTVADHQAVTAQPAWLSTASLPPTATGGKLYLSADGSIFNRYVPFTSYPVQLLSSTPVLYGQPSTRNTAWLADTDGKVIPAFIVYGWLQEALKQAAKITGGIYDATGVNTVAGNAMYQLGGDWKSLTHAWLDGWILGMGNKGDAFYRNKITAISGIVFTDVRSARSIVEYYPVPNRSGGVTTLSDNLGPADESAALTTDGGFFLSYGLAQIGSEIVGYQGRDDATLTGLLRGLSGTVAQSWPATTPVLELNGRFAGYRYPRLPHVGDSDLDLDVPPDWDVQLKVYMESQYRQAEHNWQVAKQLRDGFAAELRAWASANKPLLGPRQVGESYVNEVYGSGARMGGGWLLP